MACNMGNSAPGNVLFAAMWALILMACCGVNANVKSGLAYKNTTQLPEPYNNLKYCVIKAKKRIEYHFKTQIIANNSTYEFTANINAHAY